MITTAEDEFGPEVTPPHGRTMRQNCVKNSLALYQAVTKSSLFTPLGRSYFTESQRKLFTETHASDRISGLSARAGSEMVVMLGDSIYGAYLDKEQALLDAVDAARDALQSGREAQVWVRDRSDAARVF